MDETSLYRRWVSRQDCDNNKNTEFQCPRRTCLYCCSEIAEDTFIRENGLARHTFSSCQHAL